MPIGQFKAMWQCNAVTKPGGPNTCCVTWWPHLQLMQVAPPGGQICKQWIWNIKWWQRFLLANGRWRHPNNFSLFNIPWRHNNAHFYGLVSPNSDESYVWLKLYVALTAIAWGSAALIRFLRIFPHTAKLKLFVSALGKTNCTSMLTLQ